MRRITGSVEERRAAELLNYHRVEGGLAACMRSKGHPDVGDDRPEYLSTRPAGQIEAAFAADAACRRPAYELAMARVAPALGAWEAGHRAELDAVRQAWRRLVADATRLPR
ncbi:hypothetical protein AB0J72_22675 [Dactylosporangium sp. NPDC049742]|uniref:hypothetical protein n=1 Tax=Dactylosporangium sp. NPDC049742 TaxID=3154737 RepID=UPI00341C5C88